MHRLAHALQEANVTVLVPDLRGHGSNRPHGDIAYVGQLEDDLADFLAKEKPAYPRSRWTALGFSSGAAFTVRVAAETPLGQTFDQYVIVSPYLRYDAPSVRSPASGISHEAPSSTNGESGTWAAASTGRIIGLTLLNRIGIHFWDALPVVAFPVPANTNFATQTYSWRLQQNFSAHNDYLNDILHARRPVQVFVGAADELLDPGRLKAEIHSQRADIPVSILPGMGHSDMVTNPDAIRVLVATFS
jgi:alpha-beta hydrolase superfamily lysophospholipase